MAPVTFTIELEPEADGGWLAEVPAVPGVMCVDTAVTRTACNGDFFEAGLPKESLAEPLEARRR